MSIIDEWDREATPDERGFHNGGGFALHNWREIRNEVQRLREGELNAVRRSRLDLADEFESRGQTMTANEIRRAVAATYKLDRVSCSCARCAPDFQGFRICQTCGNKRCPHAAWHGYACSGSNEPGQEPQPLNAHHEGDPK